METVLPLLSSLSLLSWTQAVHAHPHMNVTCVETEGIPSEWMHEPAASPSVLKVLSVSLAENADGNIAHSALKLNVSWAINIDKSNDYLSGTWIDINGKPFRCLYQPPFREVTMSDSEEVWFHFADFPAEPEETYYVSGFNLPVTMAGGDPYFKNAVFQTNGCHTEQMKYHDSCVKKGSLWKPKVTSAFLKDRVEINFTSSNYTGTYDIELWKNQDHLVGTQVCHTKGESKCSTVLNSTGPCESLEIWISPHFPGCHPDCHYIVTKVDCRRTDLLEEKSDNYMIVWIVLCCVLGAAVLLLIAAYATGRAKETCSRFVRVTGTAVPVSVLIAYPAENSTFQKAVVTLAEFLKSHCNCKVTIDVWQRGQVAQMGLVHWLTVQMDVAEKVIFVAAQSGSAKNYGPGPGPSDYTVPASVEDMFSLALSILASRAWDPVVLRKYATVHLGQKLSNESLPAVLTLCKSFCLMRDLGRLCSHLHGDRPSRNFRDFPLVRSALVSPQDDRTTMKLRNAIKDLQMWEESESTETLLLNL